MKNLFFFSDVFVLVVFIFLLVCRQGYTINQTYSFLGDTTKQSNRIVGNDLLDKITYHKLLSVEPFSNKDRDLNFLKELLANKRLFLIGENRHMDGSSLRLISRIIKFLHENCGFDVLITEMNGFLVSQTYKKCYKDAFIYETGRELLLDSTERDFLEWTYNTGTTDTPLLADGCDIAGANKLYTERLFREYIDSMPDSCGVIKKRQVRKLLGEIIPKDTNGIVLNDLKKGRELEIISKIDSTLKSIKWYRPLASAKSGV